MREIDGREFAQNVDDRIADELHGMLVRLMCGFDELGFVRELTPLEEAHIEVDTEDAANALKESVYVALVNLGLDVKSDGRDF